MAMEKRYKKLKKNKKRWPKQPIQSWKKDKVGGLIFSDYKITTKLQ